MCRLGTGTLKEPMAARDHVNGGTAGEAGGGMSEAKVLWGTSPRRRTQETVEGSGVSEANGVPHRSFRPRRERSEGSVGYQSPAMSTREQNIRRRCQTPSDM